MCRARGLDFELDPELCWVRCLELGAWGFEDLGNLLGLSFLSFDLFVHIYRGLDILMPRAGNLASCSAVPAWPSDASWGELESGPNSSPRRYPLPVILKLPSLL